MVHVWISKSRLIASTQLLFRLAIKKTTIIDDVFKSLLQNHTIAIDKHTSDLICFNLFETLLTRALRTKCTGLHRRKLRALIQHKTLCPIILWSRLHTVSASPLKIHNFSPFFDDNGSCGTRFRLILNCKLIVQFKVPRKRFF